MATISWGTLKLAKHLSGFGKPEEEADTRWRTLIVVALLTAAGVIAIAALLFAR